MITGVNKKLHCAMCGKVSVKLKNRLCPRCWNLKKPHTTGYGISNVKLLYNAHEINEHERLKSAGIANRLTMIK